MILPTPIISEVQMDGWASISKRDRNNMVKAAWDAVGLHWRQKILPKHFRAGAAQEYNYSARTSKYVRRKRKKQGHAAPLVYTGDMRRQVMSPSGQRHVANFKGVTIKLRHDIRRQEVHAEMIAVSDGDRKKLEALFHQTLAELFTQHRGSRRVKLR